MLRGFLNYGLVAAVLVWAAVVGMMAYRLEDSPWRWAFIALVFGGLLTVVGIFKIRRYVDNMKKTDEEKSEHEGQNSRHLEARDSRSAR
ncbi:Exported protein [Nitrospira sp. KM1]|nr:Exported protein [Nitrospira sp. KM1]